MIVHTYTPRPPLRTLVDCIWYAVGVDHPSAVERVLPTGRAQLVVNLREDCVVLPATDADPERRRTGAVMTGAHTRPVTLSTESRRATVGVSFRAGGAAALLDRPAGAITNSTVSLRALWGREGRILRERVLEARTPGAMFAVLESALISRYSGPAPPFVDDAVRRIRSASGLVSVNDMVERTGYSHRHFAEQFGDVVGVSPKRFARVVRFQSVLDVVEGRDDVDWAKLAVAAGYYDQAHLIREFRSFSGLTPLEYQARSPAERNHIPLDE